MNNVQAGPATEQEIKDTLLKVLIRSHLSTSKSLPLKVAAEESRCTIEELRLAAEPIVEKYYTEQIYDDNLRAFLIAAALSC